MGLQTHELILNAVSQGQANGVRNAPAMSALWAVAQELETEVDVLNFALTLEHLEAAFYRDGNETFSADDFESGVYDNLLLVGQHEAAHVETLIQTINDLGGEPVEEAEYDFGYGDDPDAYLATAATLENVGVSAYDGAAQFLSTPALITAAGTIVAVEARHASYLNLVTGEVPFPDAFETPMTPQEVLDAAGGFIVS